MVLLHVIAVIVVMKKYIGLQSCELTNLILPLLGHGHALLRVNEKVPCHPTRPFQRYGGHIDFETNGLRHSSCLHLHSTAPRI